MALPAHVPHGFGGFPPRVRRWQRPRSACRYLADLIDIFEAPDWDWSYHAFREWDGWSVEHGSDPQDHRRAKSPTNRERLLRSWFAKNLKGA